MSMQGMSNGAEQWCPVEGGGCISEVPFNRGFIISFRVSMIAPMYVHIYLLLMLLKSPVVYVVIFVVFIVCLVLSGCRTANTAIQVYLLLFLSC